MFMTIHSAAQYALDDSPEKRAREDREARRIAALNGREPTDDPRRFSYSRLSEKRTGQPIRRNSYHAGRERGVFWRPITWKEKDAILAGAKKYELLTRHERRDREPNARNGALGLLGVEVLEFLLGLVDHRSGRLEPSLDYIAAKLRHSRKAIVAALKALRAHGFLDWMRRYVPTGNEGRGPQVQQTSNAYRLFLPPRAARLIARMIGAAPLPADEQQRQQDRAAEVQANTACLSMAELPLFVIEDDDLAARLSRLGASILARKEREFPKQPESLPSSFNMED